MNKYFFASASDVSLDDDDGTLDGVFMDTLNDFELNLKEDFDIEITVESEGMVCAFVTIKERDYNKFILLNSYPFYEKCRDLFVKIVNISYDIEYETSIEWDEVDEDGEYL